MAMLHVRTAATATPAAHVRSVAFAVAYLVAALLGRLTVLDGTTLSLVWPAAGVAAFWFCVQRRAGTRAVDLTLLAGVTFLIDLATGTSPGLSAGFALSNVLQVLVFLRLFARWCPTLWGAGGEEPLTGVRSLALLIQATLVATAVGAAVGPTALWLSTGYWSWPDTMVWFSRNTVSIVLTVTAGLRFGVLLAGRLATGPGEEYQVRLPFLRPTRWRLAELALVLVASVVVYALVFWWTTLPLAFFTMPMTVWVALRFDTTVVVVHDLIAGSAAVLFTLSGHGPFAAVVSDAGRALTIQTFVGLLTVIGLALALSRDEREVLLGQVRHQADAAAQQVEHLEVLSAVSRELIEAADPRESICTAALTITGGDAAYLLEPMDGYLVSTTSVGFDDLPEVRIPLAAQESMTVRALSLRELRFVADAPNHPEVSQQIVEALRVRSAVWQPIVAKGGHGVGVISIVFRRPVASLAQHVPALLGALAGEAASALERAALLERLAAAADHDTLTGIANRRLWDRTAEAEITRAGRTGHPLSFALLDLDHFKRYNDTRGHLAGDELLRAFAEAAGTCLREGDTIARWGGEEFAVALPGCGALEATAVAERIRRVVPDGQTCTVGIVEWVPGQSAQDALTLADAALYAGKRSGRDTVRTAGPSLVNAG